MPNFDFEGKSIQELIDYMKWFTRNLDGGNIKYFAWGDSIVDNVDATHKLKLKFYIPDGVLKVQKLTLNFSVEAFRAYETGAASGGSSTLTSANSDFDYDLVTQGAHWSITEDGIGAYTDGNAGHVHTVTDEGGTYTTSGAGAHAHSVTMYTHYHDLNASGLSHTHDVTIPSHTHGITYGIYESTSAAGCIVYVDGTLRLNNDGAGYSTDQANLDLTQWVSSAGWHTIEVSSTQLGRINAAYFVQVYVGNSGL